MLLVTHLVAIASTGKASLPSISCIRLMLPFGNIADADNPVLLLGSPVPQLQVSSLHVDLPSRVACSDSSGWSGLILDFDYWDGGSVPLFDTARAAHHRWVCMRHSGAVLLAERSCTSAAELYIGAIYEAPKCHG